MTFNERRACELLNTDKVTIVATVEISHIGWEFDNKAWVVRTAAGTLHVLSTDHGSTCKMSESRLREQHTHLLKQAAEIDSALLLLKASK